jgi:hypothetical protein
LLVVGPDDDEEEMMDEVMSDLTTLLNSIDKSGRGVCVQASTLGSLEALLDFLKVSKIPVSGINIGPVHKKDIMRAATMLEKAKELACILCFDVTVDKEAEKLAEEMGIRLFKGASHIRFPLYVNAGPPDPSSRYHLPPVRCLYGIQRRDYGGEEEGRGATSCLAMSVEDNRGIREEGSDHYGSGHLGWDLESWNASVRCEDRSGHAEEGDYSPWKDVSTPFHSLPQRSAVSEVLLNFWFLLYPSAQNLTGN